MLLIHEANEQPFHAGAQLVHMFVNNLSQPLNYTLTFCTTVFIMVGIINTGTVSSHLKSIAFRLCKVGSQNVRLKLKVFIAVKDSLKC